MYKVYFSWPSGVLRKFRESSRVLIVYASLGNSLMRRPSFTISSATRSELVKDLRQGSSSFLTLWVSRSVPWSPKHLALSVKRLDKIVRYLLLSIGMKISSTVLSRLQRRLSTVEACTIPPTSSLWNVSSPRYFLVESLRK